MELLAYVAVAAAGLASGLFFKTPILIFDSVLLMTVVFGLGITGGLPLSHIFQNFIQAMVLLQAMYVIGVLCSTLRRGNSKES